MYIRINNKNCKVFSGRVKRTSKPTQGILAVGYPVNKGILRWFLVTLFKDNLTEDQLAKLGLNDRQLKAVQKTQPTIEFILFLKALKYD